MVNYLLCEAVQVGDVRPQLKQHRKARHYLCRAVCHAKFNSHSAQASEEGSGHCSRGKLGWSLHYATANVGSVAGGVYNLLRRPQNVLKGFFGRADQILFRFGTSGAEGGSADDLGPRWAVHG